MQLRLNNVAKVKDATINVDGITVIAGENNTGKSTIGKTLFTIFNSNYNMQKKIEREKHNKIQKIVLFLLQKGTFRDSDDIIEYRTSYKFSNEKFLDNIGQIILNEKIEDIEPYIRKLVYNIGLANELENPEEWISECVDRLEAIINIPDKKIMMEVVTRWFNNVFEDQISPLTSDNTHSKIELNIKDKICKYEFKNNVCIDLETNINILHEAFYIDNPFAIDYMSNIWVELKATDEHLLDYLRKEDGIFDNLFETILAKDKLVEIDNILSKIVGGEFIESLNGEYCLSSKKFKNPINIKNLSTGLKSFALIKRLLENGSLKERDVLILDEPEIHLHPEWQLAYAEIMVLLQKKFDLTMIITTHSPYFLDAIDVYAAKYKISNRVNYYLAECIDEVSYLYDVTGNIDRIYKKLSDPLQKLENIRSELM